MNIDWLNFTPESALAGGMVIGIATAILLLFGGRIAGISGIVGGFFKWHSGDRGWRIAFVTGLIMAPMIWQLFNALPAIHIDAGYGTLAVAGLIVGLGTRYGSGCTSGHGVCGLSRMSPRSIVATAIFFTTAIATVYVIRHILS
ncbi:MAG: YeeE/YedE family protein [Nitrosomonas sp. PRO4]|nr:YeeE/YedE family protein [Nitrosomonas sp. PRO4]